MPKKFSPGDIFGVPLPDGTMAIGQVLARERDALNSVGCVFFASIATPSQAMSGKFEPVAILLVTPDLLNRGVWPILAKGEVSIPPEKRPYERFRANSWIGVIVTGSGIAQEFLGAYHGLCPWDDWHDPNYLDTLLLPNVERPKHVVLRKSS